jgi:hypothetical protein
VEAEIHSASQSGLEKPPNTPEMSARDAEAVANAILLDSPLPNLEWSNDEISEGDGSSKLLEGGEGKKLPEGGIDKHPAETPAGKLVVPCRKGILLFALSVIK